MPVIVQHNKSPPITAPKVATQFMSLPIHIELAAASVVSIDEVVVAVVLVVVVGAGVVVVVVVIGAGVVVVVVGAGVVVVVVGAAVVVVVGAAVVVVVQSPKPFSQTPFEHNPRYVQPSEGQIID